MLTTLENKTLTTIRDDKTLRVMRETLRRIPTEQPRLAARLAELRERRQPAAKRVTELRVLVQVSRAKPEELERAQDLLRDLDADIDATTESLNEIGVMSSTLQQSIKEREKEVLAEMAPPLAAEVLQVSEQVAAKLEELAPLVAKLTALEPRVSQFSHYGYNGIEIFDRSLSKFGRLPALVRFFTGQMRGGLDFARTVEQFRDDLSELRSRVK